VSETFFSLADGLFTVPGAGVSAASAVPTRQKQKYPATELIRFERFMYSVFFLSF
jgi:hypothetical protein